MLKLNEMCPTATLAESQDFVDLLLGLFYVCVWGGRGSAVIGVGVICTLGARRAYSISTVSVQFMCSIIS